MKVLMEGRWKTNRSLFSLPFGILFVYFSVRDDSVDHLSVLKNKKYTVHETNHNSSRKDLKQNQRILSVYFNSHNINTTIEFAVKPSGHILKTLKGVIIPKCAQLVKEVYDQLCLFSVLWIIF